MSRTKRADKEVFRLQFDFTAKEIQEIDELVSKYNCASKAELMRRMRRFFVSVQDVTDPNGCITVLSPTDEKIRFIF